MREAAIMSNAFTNDFTNTRNLGTFFLAFVHALVGMKFVEV
jgi:succinate dehydrogenase hydrophobic anchor subunit